MIPDDPIPRDPSQMPFPRCLFSDVSSTIPFPRCLLSCLIPDAFSKLTPPRCLFPGDTKSFQVSRPGHVSFCICISCKLCGWHHGMAVPCAPLTLCAPSHTIQTVHIVHSRGFVHTQNTSAVRTVTQVSYKQMLRFYAYRA